jgi:hypothetical protein
MLESRSRHSIVIYLLVLVSFSMSASLAFAANGGRPSVLVNPHMKGNGTATTIQEGINLVDPGGRVMVLPGTYAEALVIRKGLTLEAIGGESGPVIVAPPAGSAVAIDVGGQEPVTIRGIQIEHSGLHGILGNDAVNLTAERSSVVGALGTGGRGVFVVNDVDHSGARARLVVLDSYFDLLQRPSSPDGPPQFQNFAINPLGDVDALIQGNVVRRTGGACIFVESPLDFTGVTNADVVGNDLDECYPAGRAGSLLVGPAGGLRPSATVTATGTINIIGNIIRNSTGSCRASSAINFEMYDGQIEDNVITDIVQPCALPSVRNLQAGIWVGSLLSHRGPIGLPPATPVVRFNDISGNAFAGVRVSPDQHVSIEATCNWWGSASGPSGIGPGSGDAAIGAVDFVPWATEPVAGGAHITCSGGG